LPWGKDVRPARRVLFQDVVLDCAAELRRIDAAFLRDNLVHEEQQRRRGIDRHRGRHRRLVNAIKEAAHIVQR
jgi:hypothetical protein